MFNITGLHQILCHFQHLLYMQEIYLLGFFFNFICVFTCLWCYLSKKQIYPKKEEGLFFCYSGEFIAVSAVILKYGRRILLFVNSVRYPRMEHNFPKSQWKNASAAFTFLCERKLALWALQLMQPVFFSSNPQLLKKNPSFLMVGGPGKRFDITKGLPLTTSFRIPA